MFKRLQWLWTIYGVLIFIFTVKEAYYLCVPDSEVSLYYLILRAFDPTFYIAFSAHIFRLFLNLIHCLPLLLYAYRIRFLPPSFWQHLFWARCLFEVIGNTHEMTSLLAFSHSRPEWVWVFPVLLVSPYIPSYVACYLYAFRQEKIFAEK